MGTSSRADQRWISRTPCERGVEKDGAISPLAWAEESIGRFGQRPPRVQLSVGRTVWTDRGG